MQVAALVAMVRTLKGCTRVGEAPTVRGKVWIHGHGDIAVGDRVVFDAADAPIELHAKRGATIVIGDDSVLSGGASIDATSSITLGARCRVGAFCKVMDNHFHALRGDRHVRPQATPVVVEDDVELGADSILLPGAHVGRGSRIGPRAVVRRRVAPGSVVAGPAMARRERPRRAPVPQVDASVVIPMEETDLPIREVVMKATALALEALRFAQLVVVQPAEARIRLRRYVGAARAAILFRDCLMAGPVNAQGFVRVVAEGEVRLGDHVDFVRGVIPTWVVAHGGAELVIGAGTVVAPAAHLEASRSVRIGERCLIASRVRVCDYDGDGVAPIVIGDDVWLAHGVTIEPGVTIGAGSVVSAGSLVRHDVPPRSLAVDARAHRPSPPHA
jgi:acetyltransferase-like isoleucine patch superfamily enzyme